MTGRLPFRVITLNAHEVPGAVLSDSSNIRSNPVVALKRFLQVRGVKVPFNAKKEDLINLVIAAKDNTIDPTIDRDMKYTYLDTTMELDWSVSNGSPLPCQFVLDINKRPTELYTQGVKISGLWETITLLPGETKTFNIQFHPKSKVFRLKKKKKMFFRWYWHLFYKVTCGPIIPLMIKTRITIPVISVPSSINFGEARCYEKKVMIFKIENNNVAPAEWSFTVSKIYRKIGNSKVKNYLDSDEYCPFTLVGDERSGILEPGMSHEIEFIFEPLAEGLFKGKMTFKVNLNDLEYELKFQGKGFAPSFEFNQLDIDFGSVVPFSDAIVNELFLTNPCTFPIEVFFPLLDKNYREELYMIETVLKYMKTDKLYLEEDFTDPALLSYNVQQMYQTIVNQARTFEQEENEHCADEKELIRDFLEFLDLSPDIRRNDVTHCLQKKLSSIVPRPSLTGRLILFTGAPSTDYVTAANKAAKRLGFRATSMDAIIYEEAALSDSPQAKLIRDRIDRVYFQLAKRNLEIPENQLNNDYYKVELLKAKIDVIANAGDLPSNIFDSPPLPPPPPPPDTVDEILEEEEQSRHSKEYSKHSVKQKKSGKSGGGTSKDGRKSKTAESLKDQDAFERVHDTFLKIPLHMLCDLIESKVKQLIVNPGLVVEKLTGLFVPDKLTQLKMWLQFGAPLDNTDIVNLFDTMEAWNKRKEMIVPEIMKDAREETMALFGKICKMSLPEYASLSEEDRLLYRNEMVKAYYTCHTGKIEIDEEASKANKAGKKKGQRRASQKRQSTGGRHASQKRQSTGGRRASQKRQSTGGRQASQKRQSTGGSRASQKRQSTGGRQASQKRQSTGGSRASQKRQSTGGRRASQKRKSTGGRRASQKRQSTGGQKQRASMKRTSGHGLLMGSSTKKRSIDPAILEEQKMTEMFDVYDKFIRSAYELLQEHESTNKKVEKKESVSSKKQKRKTSSRSGGHRPSLSAKSSILDAILPDNVRTWVINTQPVAKDMASTERLLQLIEQEDFKRTAAAEQAEAKRQQAELKKTSRTFFRLCSPKFIIRDILSEIGLEKGQEDEEEMNDKTKVFSIHEPVTDVWVSYIEPAELIGVSRRRTEEEEPEMSCRFRLAPGERLNLNLAFDPRTIGVFEEKFPMMVKGWPDSMKIVTLRGVADMPLIDLDPRVLLPWNGYVEEELIDDHMLSLARSRLVFEPTFIGHEKGDRKHQNSAFITYKNASRIDCTVLISIQVTSAPFGLAEDKITIPVGEVKKLEVHAFPHKKNMRSCTIITSIKDNPIPIFIKAVADGMLPSLKITPHKVELKKVLIFRKASTNIVLTSTCIRPLLWSINPTSLLNFTNLRFSTLRGAIKYHQSHTISVTYCPDREETVKAELGFLLYSSSFKKPPLAISPRPVQVILTSKDVVVDIIYNKDIHAESLKFKKSLVDTTRTKIITLMNRGKYEFYYRFHYPENIMKSRVGMFKLSRKVGRLKKKNKKNVKVKVKSHQPTCLNKEAAMYVEIIDPPTGDLIVDLPIYISYTSTYAKFEVTPVKDFQFGGVEVQTERRYVAFLKNTGSLTFTYEILAVPSEHKFPGPSILWPASAKWRRDGNLMRRDSEGKISEYVDILKRSEGALDKISNLSSLTAPSSVPSFQSLTASAKSAKAIRERKKRVTVVKEKKKGHHRPDSRKKKRKVGTGKMTTCRVQAGPFHVDGNRGKIRPGSTAEIEIFFNPYTNVKFSENLLLKVTGASPPQKDTIIHLSGEGLFPEINRDIKVIMRDLYHSVSDQQAMIKNGMPCSIFNRSKSRIECFNFIVGKPERIVLCLENTSLVQDKLTASLQNEEQHSGQEFQFKFLDGEITQRVQVNPLSMYDLQIQFTPYGTEEIETLLILELHMPEPLGDREHRIKLKGRGHIPRVILTQPAIVAQDEVNLDERLLDVGSAIIGCQTEGVFAFKNVGDVHAKVLFEFIDVNVEVFSFTPTKDETELLKHPSNSPLIEPVVFKMPVGREVQMSVIFTPKGPEKERCKVLLRAIHNQYESLNILIEGRGVVFPVIFQLPYAWKIQEIVQKLSVVSEGSKRKSMAKSITNGPAQNQKKRKSTMVHTTTPTAQLDLGACLVGDVIKKQVDFRTIGDTFTLKHYRVQFPTHENVAFIPSLLHVAPSFTRQAWAIFHSKDILDLNEEMTMTFEEIAYDKPQAANVVWDNAPHLYNWISDHKDSELRWEDVKSSEKYVEEEPKYALVASQTSPIHVTGSACNPDLTFHLDDSETHELLVTFPHSVTNEERHAILFLKNKTKLNTPYVLEISEPVHSTMEPSDDYSAPLCSIGLDFPLDATIDDLNFRGNEIKLCSPVETERATKIPRLGRVYRPQPLDSNQQFHEQTAQVRMATTAIERKQSDIFNKFHGNPFSISPNEGIAAGSATTLLKLKFIPRFGGKFESDIVCMAQSTNGESMMVDRIKVIGTCERAPLHLVAEQGPYIISEKLRDPVRSLEIRSFDIDKVITRRFWLVNTTENCVCYNFRELFPSTVLMCYPKTGCISPYLAHELIICFSPNAFKTFKNVLSLTINDIEDEQYIALTGQAMKPKISIYPKVLRMPLAQLGNEKRAVITIANEDEKAPVNFSVDESSLNLQNNLFAFTVTPVKGHLKPMSAKELKVKFLSRLGGEANCRVQINVEGQNEPLEAHIFAECLDLECLLSVKLEDQHKRILTATNENKIDLGPMILNVSRPVKLLLSNVGTSNIHFTMEYADDRRAKPIKSIECVPMLGTVNAKESAELFVYITPLQRVEIDDCFVSLKISRGPEFKLHLYGNASSPAVSFNFKTHDFGPCLVQTTNQRFNHVELRIFNNEIEDLKLEKMFENREHLVIQMNDNIIRSKTETLIFIEFRPKKVQKYRDELNFLIGGYVMYTVLITGEGAEMRINLKKSSEAFTNLEGVNMGSSRVVRRKIVNSSRTTAHCKLHYDPPVTCKFFEIQPDRFELKPHQELNLEITYVPEERFQRFITKVSVECQDALCSLFTIRGSSANTEFSLDQSIVLFGSVVKYCSTSRKVILSNTGDIGCNYEWQYESVAENLRIFPEKGYIPPDSRFLFDILFFSEKEMSLKAKIFLKLEKYATFPLQVIGKCTDVPDPSNTIVMSSPVRTVAEEIIVIENKLPEKVTVFPVIVGEHFSSVDALELQPNSSVNCSIYYSPTVMTRRHCHFGRLFVPFQTGDCLVYGLTGVSLPPVPEDTIKLELVEKEEKKLVLKVTNWLPVFQTFEIAVRRKAEDFPYVHFNGDCQITVEPHASIKYTLKLTVYSSCQLEFDVAFTNPVSKEYLFYKIKAIVTPVTVLQTFYLETRVREKLIFSIPVYNPLSFPEQFSLISNIPSVRARPVNVRPEAQEIMNLEFMPLVPHLNGKVEGLVTVMSPTLGGFPYRLILHALPPLPEPPKYLETCLGESVNFSEDIANLSVKPASFKTEVDSKDFALIDSFELKPQDHKKLDIVFEPTRIGASQNTLTVSSMLSGEFIFPLHSVCLFPKTYGPVLIKSGSTIVLPFKNVFHESKEYHYTISGDVFQVVNPNEAQFVLKSKEAMNFKVRMLNPDSIGEDIRQELPVGGKLTVFLASNEELQWNYFIKGIIRDNDEEENEEEEELE